MKPADESIKQLFPLINLFIGLIILLPNTVTPDFRSILDDFMPVWSWGLYFVIGALVGLWTTRKMKYILFVSLPLLLYSSVILRGFLFDQMLSLTGVTTYLLLGLYSIHYAVRNLR